MSNHGARHESESSLSDVSLSELRGDCARMAPHWVARARPAPDRVAPERIHGVRVPAASVRLVDGMSEYGD